VRVASLISWRRRILALAEESILADRAREHARRTLADGTTFDMTAYREFDVLLSFQSNKDGSIVFIDFMFHDEPDLHTRRAPSGSSASLEPT